MAGRMRYGKRFGNSGASTTVYVPMRIEQTPVPRPFQKGRRRRKCDKRSIHERAAVSETQRKRGGSYQPPSMPKFSWE